MTDETPIFPELPEPAAKDAPRSKRISNPRPKKTTRESHVETPAEPAESPELPVATPEAPVATPELPVATPEAPAESPEVPAETPEVPAETPEAPVATPEVPAESPEDDSSTEDDWAEPEPASNGAAPTSEHPKRKRRRKKGKGGGAHPPMTQNQPPQNDSEPQIPVVFESPESQATPRPNPQPRIKFDAEVVAKLAWKIYLSEVSEEGVALIGDGDAKDLARRCFRLSEIFLEEQSRRS